MVLAGREFSARSSSLPFTLTSLGREDSPGKEMATHSSTLAWRTPWTGEPGRLAGRGWDREHAGLGQPEAHRTLLSAGAFLIPYFIFLFGGGLPVFFLEVIIGQYTSEGGITCWEKICPLFAGECGTKVARGLVVLGSAHARCPPATCQAHWGLMQASLAHGGAAAPAPLGCQRTGDPVAAQR